MTLIGGNPYDFLLSAFDAFNVANKMFLVILFVQYGPKT